MPNTPYYVARTNGSSWLVALVAVLVLALAGFFAWHRYSGRGGAPPAELPRASPPAAVPSVQQPPLPAVASPMVADARAGAAATTPPVAGKPGTMRFPDGSTRPALNGVTEVLEIPWPSDRPWSPVVEQVHHNNVDWFRHADGSFSTTIVRKEEVSGRMVQMPLCYTPAPAVGTPTLRQPAPGPSGPPGSGAR